MKTKSVKDTFIVKLATSHIFQSRFWLSIAAILFVTNLITPFFIISSMSSENKVVVLDNAGSFILTKATSFDEAKELHEYMVLQSCEALLSLNPEGYDYPELLERIYLTNALGKANQLFKNIEEEIKGKNVIQKPNIFSTKISKAVIDGVDCFIAEVQGEVVRGCKVGSTSYLEKEPFTLKLQLLRNKNLITNKRFPLAVNDFKLKFS